MYGGESADVIMSTARGEELVGHVGLYPQFSLLNHSAAFLQNNHGSIPRRASFHIFLYLLAVCWKETQGKLWLHLNGGDQRLWATMP
eukprot:scaffold107172_cov18-Tisochrysis_lutea.AAC.1